MSITGKHKNLSARLFDTITSYAVLALIMLCIVLLLRLFEVIYNLYQHSTPVDLLQLSLNALANDLFFWIKFSAISLPIYLLLFFVSPKLAKVIFISTVFIYLVLHLSLGQYFSLAMVPLGADIYGYTMGDVRQTIGASGHTSVWLIVGFVVIILAVISALILLPKKIQFGRRLSLSFVMLPFLAVTLTSFIVIPGPALGSEFLNNLVLNKTDFFVSQSLHHFFPEENEPDIYADAYIGEYSDGPTPIINFEYLDQGNFPFLHKDNATDVLSPFLNKASQAPNIVIVLVEGLGRAFTNEGAYLGNFTPFIDSLSNQSLYWENFLSEGGRTFAVLPSVLGSLPFLKKGFADMGDAMPRHLSLVSLLKSNGYYTSFYYGGDSRFDNMNLFLQKSNIDRVNDEKTFGSGYTPMPKSSNGFSWGYGDKELFRKYFDTKAGTSSKPFLDIILTVSTHTPFLINQQQQYLDKFETRLQQLGFDESKKTQYRDYKMQYASILFADDAIGEFIGAYSKRPDFNNTLFFITGDHRMPEIPMVSKIDRYHVPLLIYSPLLKRTAKFSSVSTHFDITPSILAYLKGNFPMQLPSVVSWVGSGLDTSRSLHNLHAYPLLQTKTNLVDFMADDHLLNNQQLFKVKEGLHLAEVTDDGKASLLQRSFDEFKRKNESIVNGSQLIPDSIYSRYFPR